MKGIIHISRKESECICHLDLGRIRAEWSRIIQQRVALRLAKIRGEYSFEKPSEMIIDVCSTDKYCSSIRLPDQIF